MTVRSNFAFEVFFIECYFSFSFNIGTILMSKLVF